MKPHELHLATATHLPLANHLTSPISPTVVMTTAAGPTHGQDGQLDDDDAFGHDNPNASNPKPSGRKQPCASPSARSSPTELHVSPQAYHRPPTGSALHAANPSPPEWPPSRLHLRDRRARRTWMSSAYTLPGPPPRGHGRRGPARPASSPVGTRWNPAQQCRRRASPRRSRPGHAELLESDTWPLVSIITLAPRSAAASAAVNPAAPVPHDQNVPSICGHLDRDNPVRRRARWLPASP